MLRRRRLKSLPASFAAFGRCPTLPVLLVEPRPASSQAGKEGQVWCIYRIWAYWGLSWAILLPPHPNLTKSKLSPAVADLYLLIRPETIILEANLMLIERLPRCNEVQSSRPDL